MVMDWNMKALISGQNIPTPTPARFGGHEVGLEPYVPQVSSLGGAGEPSPADKEAWVRWKTQQYIDSGRDMASAFNAAADEWDYFYGAKYGQQPSTGRIEFPSEAAFREAQTGDIYWQQQFAQQQEQRGQQQWAAEQQYAEQQAQRAGQQWAAEQQYQQALNESRKRTAALEAQLTAMTQLAPNLAAVEPSGYMTGFAPGQIGERLGIPYLRPTRMDINPVIQQMQNVQYPQINWQSYLGGQ